MADFDEPGDAQAPICICGVTALPDETGTGYVCENPDCEAFGDTV